MTHQNCISEPAHLLAASIINTITDFLVVTLPIPTVWKLKLAGREQVILVLLFGVGFMVSIAGCVRTVYTYQAAVSNDRTWAIYPVWLSSCVELYVGIVRNLQSYKETFLIKRNKICASIPATKKFFSHFIPRLLDSDLTRSRTAISMQTKSYHSSTPATIPNFERAVRYNTTSPLPYEVKDPASSSVQDVAGPESSFFGFDFGVPERADTTQSSMDGHMEETYESSPVESHDDLLYSRTERGAFG
jgi:hypothetical protein